MSYILSFKRKGTVTPPLSDLVALGILPKQISEFTNADIGTEVSIPYTDSTGKILLNEGRIEFEVVGVNHHKDTNNADTPTITLMTKNIIRYAAFDAKEPNNTLIDPVYDAFMRAQSGNNHWSVSNIRQWLNSDATGSWFTAQHEYDASPTADRVNGSDGAYADAPGFLAGFGENVRQHLTEITNTTAVPNADGGGFERTVDKVFLPSYTEMGFGSNGDFAEGSALSKFSSESSRIKQLNGADGHYWMRSPNTGTHYYTKRINTYGDSQDNNSYNGYMGIAPIIVLH